MNHGRDVQKHVRDGRSDRTRRRQRGNGHDCAPDVGLYDFLGAEVRVPQMVRRGDEKDGEPRQHRGSHLSAQPSFLRIEGSPHDDPRKRVQQHPIYYAVNDTAPEHGTSEGRAGEALGLGTREYVLHHHRSDDDPEDDAPLPALRQPGPKRQFRLDDVDSEESDDDGEVDEVVEINRKGDQVAEEERGQKANDGSERYPDEM